MRRIAMGWKLLQFPRELVIVVRALAALNGRSFGAQVRAMLAEYVAVSAALTTARRGEETACFFEGTPTVQ
jgi:hypothetical protein